MFYEIPTQDNSPTLISAPSSSHLDLDPSRIGCGGSWPGSSLRRISMDLLDATIVNVAGPSIHRNLGGGPSTLQWLSAGYTLAFAVLLIAGARLGDIFGRRRLFLIGSAGFTLFSSACAVAPGIGVLISFRILQGAFGALMIPQGFGLAKQVFDDDVEFNKVMGFFGPATGVAMLGAPVLAGALMRTLECRVALVFLINLPIGLVTFVLALRSLPRGASHPNVKLDVGVVLLIGAALVAIIYPLIEGRSEGWPRGASPCSRGRAPAPHLPALRATSWYNALIEPTLLRNRTYLSGIAVALALFGAFGGTHSLRLTLRPARRGVVPDSRRSDVDPDGGGDDLRDARLPGARKRSVATCCIGHRADRARCDVAGTDPHECEQRHELGSRCPASYWLVPVSAPASDSSFSSF